MGRNSQLFLSGCCPAPTCTAPAPWEVDREVFPGYREEEPCWGRGLGSDHAQGVTVIGLHHLPKGGTWWGLEGRHQRPAMVLLPASGKRQNWGNKEQSDLRTKPHSLPTLLSAAPFPGAPTFLPGAQYSQALTSQSLLGKVLDIHILVLGQLLQDGLDFTLQCAGKGGEKKCGEPG